jgi:hypothetical protein
MINGILWFWLLTYLHAPLWTEILAGIYIGCWVVGDLYLRIDALTKPFKKKEEK